MISYRCFITSLEEFQHNSNLPESFLNSEVKAIAYWFSGFFFPLETHVCAYPVFLWVLNIGMRTCDG